MTPPGADAAYIAAEVQSILDGIEPALTSARDEIMLQFIAAGYPMDAWPDVERQYEEEAATHRQALIARCHRVLSVWGLAP